MTRTNSDRGNAGVIALVIIGLLIAASIGLYVFGPSIGIFTQQREAADDIVESEVDAESALENYRWFRTQYYDIKAKRDQINNTRQQMQMMEETYGNDSAEWPRDVRQDYNRLQQQMLGQQNMHDQMVAEYNARAEDPTRAIWKCGLPYETQKKFYIEDLRGGDKYVDNTQFEIPPDDPQECLNKLDLDEDASQQDNQ